MTSSSSSVNSFDDNGIGNYSYSRGNSTLTSLITLALWSSILLLLIFGDIVIPTLLVVSLSALLVVVSRSVLVFLFSSLLLRLGLGVLDAIASNAVSNMDDDDSNDSNGSDDDSNDSK